MRIAQVRGRMKCVVLFLLSINSNMNHWSAKIRVDSFTTSSLFRGHFQIAELIVIAGYNLQEEAYLFTDDDQVPDTLLCNIDFWMWLCQFTKNPMPLLLQCRRSIHRCLGKQTVHSVDGLPLPPRLRDFILLKDTVVV